MLASNLRYCKVLGMSLLACCALITNGRAASSDVIGAAYRPDTPFPQFMHLWHEGWRVKDADGETIQYAHKGMPLGGYVHVYFRNSSKDPLEITDVLLDGVSLVVAIAFSDDLESGLHPASIHFAKLPKHQLDRLIAAGEPVWWKVNPDPIPPGAMGELIIRLRREPKNETLRVNLLGGNAALGGTVRVTEVQPQMVDISFSPELDTAYLYLRHPDGPGIAPKKIFLDGEDVTSHSKIGSDRDIDTVPVVIRLDKPLLKSSFRCFKAVYPDGSAALAGIRAWSDDLAYGMWGSSGIGNTPGERARNYLMDMHEHNINVHMGMYSGSSKAFMESREGWDFEKSIGMRAMATWYGNTSNPMFYFLMDEPDAQDFGVDGLEPFQRLGTLAQPLIGKSKVLRRKDSVTPQLLNIDNTYKPENWYMYGQLPDVMCADPYYQEQLRQVYLSWPTGLAFHTKPTYVYAVGTICHSACAPRPLHLILQSVRHDMPDMPLRFPTPEEKRIEVYYTLAAGAKGLSFWWYTPAGECYGCGAKDADAVPLWKEIGLLGAEVRTAGPVIMRSCPAAVPAKASRQLWVRSLLAGLDTLVMVVVNENVASDRVGTAVEPVGNASMAVDLPSWLQSADVFEITYEGTKDLSWQRAGSKLSIDLGKVELTRLILISADGGLRDRLQTLYETQFASNVRRLLAGRGG